MLRFLLQHYDVTAEGNFEGHNILNRLKDLPRSKDDESAARHCCAPSCCSARSKRVRPGLDDKVLADWNGLMIAALVNAGACSAKPDWVEHGRSAPSTSSPAP